MHHRKGNLLALVVLIVCVSTFGVFIGCNGPQSALNPAGESASRLATLFWWMAGAGSLAWAIVIGLAVYSIRINPASHDIRQSRTFIIGGGVIAPTLILTVLLVYGLAMLPDMVAPAPDGSLRIRVSGAQWWWRVEYLQPDSNESRQNVVELAETFGGQRQGSKLLASSATDVAFELANEIRLPVNQPVQFYLQSEDVIHSFWIPSLGGKVDMIPGRQTRLTLYPTKTGIYRGACAEYCGASHSWMNFYVVVMEQDEFERWYRSQSSPAVEPVSPAASRGKQLFASTGCNACHTIRGTNADGVVGPNLTHVGSRISLAAGVFTGGNPSNPSVAQEDFYEWLRDPKAYKPSAHMPHFGMLADDELQALAAYLKSLK